MSGADAELTGAKFLATNVLPRLSAAERTIVETVDMSVIELPEESF